MLPPPPARSPLAVRRSLARQRVSQLHLFASINRQVVAQTNNTRLMSANGHVSPTRTPRHRAQGTQSHIPHPPPEDHPTHETRGIPDTGWRGELPSMKGGTYEQDYMRKPPYEWKSEGGLFKAKYYRRSPPLMLLTQCWCGHVAFESTHCHCRQCQRLHGAPFQWAVIFPKVIYHLLGCNRALTRARGQTSARMDRLLSIGRNTVLAYPASFRFKDGQHPLDFQPTAHIFYGQRTMPKYKGKPNAYSKAEKEDQGPELA
ncbi:uncharacterized protein B0H18DRAFT_1000064 [Fomitopsis serialis]|uniref:uncharacterized protein n=1 Tax=Fomitopsis serialis TaxID=139415 RepID=UPI002008644B|nr:uncharacterized protein B0H18DRAFT_1000064 [Neoantrodia serialis]KAH9928669.1 hypothetical protein B0H18DRAFT_1000064 [Neoantrodia serialis]